MIKSRQVKGGEFFRLKTVHLDLRKIISPLKNLNGKVEVLKDLEGI